MQRYYYFQDIIQIKQIYEHGEGYTQDEYNNYDLGVIRNGTALEFCNSVK